MGRLYRCVTGVLVAAMVLVSATQPAQANSKYAAFVMHADSGDVLFDRYSTSRRYPASLTKMMTLYLLFDELEAGNVTLETKLKVSKRAAGQPPSKLGVSAGGTISVEDAIKALVVKSANDVAVVVAEHISGSEWRFALKMTEKANALDMRRTRFRNASGLPNSKQVTTARDMATLARRIIQDHTAYFPYFSTQSFTWNSRTYRTHNALVRTFDGADGMKTGYTRMSGFNLTTTAARDGHRLIGVVLGGRSGATRDRHMREILNNAFTAIEKKPALIASLYRNTPEPRIKPTLLAQIEASKPPTIDGSEELRSELIAAAAEITGADDTPAGDGDALATLIAFADTDDFNEFEIARLASLAEDAGFIGQGDRESLSEFSWSIQIGAYSSKSLAQKELEAAVLKGDLASRSRSVLPTPRDDGSMLYRARISNLSEAEAANGCATLKTKNVTCFIVSGDEATKQ